MADTAIEWADAVWNPTTGCNKVSPGCDNCYALTMAKRLKGMGQPKYQTDGDPRTSGPGFGLTVHEDVLGVPLRWRKPKRIFVNSMSDLFHDKVPDAFIAEVFAVMRMADQHTFQVLTKRHARLRSLLNSDEFRGLYNAALHLRAPGLSFDVWPVPNVWVGVSVEDQHRAYYRINALLDTPAAVRWLSCEPLLGSINIWHWIEPGNPDAQCLTCGTEELSDLDGHPVIHFCNDGDGGCAKPDGGGCELQGAETGEWCDGPIRPYNRGLHWVVVGGESGPGARPMHPDWARSLRDQCTAAGVPFFMKQAGAVLAREWSCSDPKGHNPSEWPEHFPREYPNAA